MYSWKPNKKTRNILIILLSWKTFVFVILKCSDCRIYDFFSNFGTLHELSSIQLRTTSTKNSCLIFKLNSSSIWTKWAKNNRTVLEIRNYSKTNSRFLIDKDSSPSRTPVLLKDSFIDIIPWIMYKFAQGFERPWNNNIRNYFGSYKVHAYVNPI